MGGLSEQLSKIGLPRLFIMFGVTAGMAAALMFGAMRLGQEHEALLFAGLDLAEAGEIVSRLDQAGIGHSLRAGGTAIYVPSDAVTNARMMIAAEGLPSAGSVGYEIFDSQDALGSSRFVQNVNRVRALEGELARTIRALDGVASARVHLALPERRLFERDQIPASASVWVSLRRGDLARDHANAVRTFVASAVPGLEASRVTILDSEGRVLARGDDSAAGGSALSAHLDDRRAGVEERIRLRVIDLVEGVVGPGGARVQVAADLDFNRVTETAEIFDPEGRVVRSLTREEETNSERDSEGDGVVSVSENVPETDGGEAGDSRSSQSNANLSRETTNYEISRRTRVEERQVGIVRRLSVAVVLDGVRTLGDDGEAVYASRDETQIEEIAALVRSAIGFDEERGDVVTVRNMAFARMPPPDTAAEAPGPFALDAEDMMRGAELGVLLLVALMIIFLVVRPLVRGAVGAPALPAAAGGATALTPVSAQTAAALDAGKAEGLPAPAESEEQIDIAKIDGQVKASSVKKVSDIVEKHPDESVSILRTWLHSD